MTILGIESSCDETAASIVRKSRSGHGEILSNVVHSQIAEHAAFGGVVPEIAARAHVEVMDSIIARSLEEAGTGLEQIDGVAATAGPGLIGGLIVGLVTAKTLAAMYGKPFMAINHLEGHILTVGLTDQLSPPYLVLLVSGGHTQLLLAHDIGRYETLGTTIDDAVGEAFDKTAKLLGFPYPGGPLIEKFATQGDPARFELPRPMLGRSELNFSFSGLKTALRRIAERSSPLDEKDIADLCASFQCAVTDCLEDRVAAAMALYLNKIGSQAANNLVVAGGVAANEQIRSCLRQCAAENGFRLFVPPASLCTDNAAMIAWTGALKLDRGLTNTLDFDARARWPFDELANK
ncbi:MAG: tRNA (adenosine(37)-N6)-threonylcarbamoyltransferase complex transferase subunit TsaD [Methyloligellaceae bacterium]